jgi:hypothetical protein
MSTTSIKDSLSPKDKLDNNNLDNLNSNNNTQNTQS